MITLNQNMKTEQNYVTWILTALLFKLKLKIFIKTLLMILENCLTHLTIMEMIRDRFQQIVIKKKSVFCFFFKDELGEKTMKKFVGLRTKTYAYIMDDDTEHKKAKGTKKCTTKRELMFKNYDDCLFNDKVKLKSQQRFKNDCDNV